MALHSESQYVLKITDELKSVSLAVPIKHTGKLARGFECSKVYKVHPITDCVHVSF